MFYSESFVTSNFIEECRAADPAQPTHTSFSLLGESWGPSPSHSTGTSVEVHQEPNLNFLQCDYDDYDYDSCDEFTRTTSNVLFFVISKNWDSNHYKKKLSFEDLVLSSHQLSLVGADDKCKIVETGLITCMNYTVLEYLIGIDFNGLRDHVTTVLTVESQRIEFVQLRICECGDIIINTRDSCEKCEKINRTCECGQPKEIYDQWCDVCDTHYSYGKEDDDI